MRTRTPLTIVTGALGGGKTTLLRRMVQAAAAESPGERLAILMNEFGAIAIDSKVVEGENVAIAELDGGCVCCSLAGEFEAAVEEIIEKVAPERIVVETTGVAEPDALVLDVEENLPQVRLDAVVTVADTDAMTRFPDLGHTERIQLECADIVLVNKADLVAPGALQAVEQRVRDVNPRAILRRTIRGDAEAGLLFGAAAAPEARKPPSRHRHEAVAVDAFTFSTARSLDRARFEEVCRGLPGEIYRAKGFVVFPGGGYLFNYVAGRADFEAYRAERTALVFIGKGAAAVAEDLTRRLRECEVADAV